MRLEDAHIIRFEKINAWNPEKLFEQRSNTEIVWDSIISGNFVGFDIWLNDGGNGRVVLESNYMNSSLPLEEIGLEDHVFDAGGLDRKLKMFRMPDTNHVFEIQRTVPMPLEPEGDNPLWVRVTTDDGYNAWSSPIYTYRKERDYV